MLSDCAARASSSACRLTFVKRGAAIVGRIGVDHNPPASEKVRLVFDSAFLAVAHAIDEVQERRGDGAAEDFLKALAQHG